MSLLQSFRGDLFLKPTLFSKKVGDRLNLETSLKLGDEINGHLVFGHVDGVGKLSQIKN